LVGQGCQDLQRDVHHLQIVLHLRTKGERCNENANAVEDSRTRI
jgi:hypothetical protein